MKRKGWIESKGTRQYLFALTIAALCAPAWADDPPIQAQLDALSQQVKAQQQEIEQLKQLLAQKNASTTPPISTTTTATATEASTAIPPPPAPAPTRAAEEDSSAASPEAPPPNAKTFDIYGFAQLDYIQDFKRVNQNWDATLRPSRIPTVAGVAGANGQAVLSVRQSRLGVKTSTPIDGQDLNTQFEFDLFGTGTDEGKTTFRLRHAYGTWGDWLAGQTNSTFMDPDVFPNVIDYWGPSGMVFIRNPQLRWTKQLGIGSFAIGIEQPGNDIDPGQIRELDPELASHLSSHEKYPDLTSHYRIDQSWGHFQVGGLLRDVGYQSLATPNNEPKGSETGWGVNLTSGIKVGQLDQLILAVVHGKGIASYMNDGGTDLAPGGLLVNPIAQVVPLTGLVAYFDHYWNDELSSSIGYSQTKVTNTSLQEANAFRLGQYASANLLYTPMKNVLTGVEFLWGKLDVKDGKTGNDSRVQFSVKYNFSNSP